jgi:hypothetical protein
LGPPSRGAGAALWRGSQYPNPGSGESPVFAGAATYGTARTDIANIYGSQFTNSGFTLKLAGLRPALYDLVVYARSTVTGTFNQQKILRLTLTADPRMWTGSAPSLELIEYGADAAGVEGALPLQALTGILGPVTVGTMTFDDDATPLQWRVELRGPTATYRATVEPFGGRLTSIVRDGGAR